MPLEPTQKARDKKKRKSMRCISYWVSVNATQKQIKKAYHMKARHVHPDRCGGTIEAKTNFQVLQKAYSILSDPEKRKLYDRTGCMDADNEQFWEAQALPGSLPRITKDDIRHSRRVSQVYGRARCGNRTKN